MLRRVALSARGLIRAAQAVSIEPSCLDGFPKLKGFYQSMMAMDCFKELSLGNYISK